MTRALLLLWGTFACTVLPAISAECAAADTLPTFERQGDILHIRANGSAMDISLRAPVFAVGELQTSGDVAPLEVQGEIAGGQTMVVSYAPISAASSKLEVKLLLRWSPTESVLRKWARVRLVGGPEGQVLKEVILERLDTQGDDAWTHGANLPGKKLMILDVPQSHPVFLPGRFVGIEFPVACTHFEDRTLALAHRPGVRLQPGTWYDTRAAVYGLTAVGEEQRSFWRYLESHRRGPSGLHVNYNSWWTSPVPYSEQDILTLMGQFQAELFQAQGVSIDTFSIDLGWSNPKTVWEIDAKQFPEGFAKIREAAQRMHAKLGLWISPSSCYPGALDSQWAGQQGFETLASPGANSISMLCLGGRKYAEQFKTRITELVSRDGIAHLKLDGCCLVCPRTDHGHEPGPYSSEAIADGVIAAATAARQANPDIWIETTCFGYNPSPWWLFYVNSVIGTFGDDAPVGRVPSPVYRESYTTARDYFNLQGTALAPIPAGAQEVLGIIHQSPDPLTNDAVVTVLRGHRFLPLYVNPKFMSPSRWKALAELLKWARFHSEILGQTTPLLPASWQTETIPQFTDQGTMPREPYGYAHIKDNRALVALRNPWIAPQRYRLALNALGFAANVADLSAVSVYPEPRLYGADLKGKDVFEVALAPYETLVLSIEPTRGSGNVPPAASAIGAQLAVTRSQNRLERVAFRESPAALGPDWTGRLGNTASALHLTLEANVQVKAPRAELLLLCESEKTPPSTAGSIRVNGQEAAVTLALSSAGWSATMLPRREHWTFVRAPLAPGDNQISADQFIGGDCTRVSAWIWATKPGSESTLPDALPQPESISLDAAALIAPVDVTSLPPAAAPIERPMDRIDGVFLDALEPASVSQGYGALEKNQSVWQKPLMIAGQRYLRGLGTHAPSKIVYALGGKYRRFQAWAGADSNTGPTVTFAVRIDGVQRWQSGPMTRDTPAARVDLDVTGVKTLELVVDDTGDLNADHADWADARLLR